MNVALYKLLLVVICCKILFASCLVFFFLTFVFQDFYINLEF